MESEMDNGVEKENEILNNIKITITTALIEKIHLDRKPKLSV